MKDNVKFRVLIFLIFLLLVGTSFAPMSISNSPSSMDGQKGRTVEGQILFAPFYTTTTYLINRDGTVNHTWPSSYQPFTEAYWLGNGTIMRPICLTSGGGLQKITWDGSLAWDYRYTASGCTCHHDIKVLPNGNVLMIVWVTKTRTQAIAAGRNPNTISGTTFTPDKIIEVHQTGPSSGTVVWEWNVWDHLIQDYDALKNNYGVVADHPELIDINFGDSFDFDWLHTNSLDYNATFNQLLISVHDFDEIWVIDHNTTTAEAAGHTGGHYGHGGDLLYRWGNPQAYRRGTANDQQLFGQHDATWIPSGYPGAGDVLVFNNGYNRPGTKYSTVDEFTPPINSTGWYALDNESAYGPEDVAWEYTASPPSGFYSNVFSSAERLMDGDTLICSGIPGKFFEVTSDGTTVWQYNNPYPPSGNKWNFKIEYIPPPPLPQQPPVFGAPNPTNGSTNNPLSLTWSIPISDLNGDLFSWTIQCNNGQANNATEATNGTKILALSDLAYATIYTVWVNATDPNGSGLYTRKWYTFTTKANQPPVFGTPNPPNNSANNPLSFTWSIPINDNEGDHFSWTMQCSNGQTNSGNGASNGTKTLNLTGLAYSTLYKVWVNATDTNGSGHYTRRWYTFTTGQLNQPPFFGIPTPANDSTYQPVNLTWSIPINDPNGDHFSWTMQCSNGQTNSGTQAANGTKTLVLTGLMYTTLYKIWVNATDPTGSGLYTRRWYTFTTKANQPPETPTITGPTQGKKKVNTVYNFTTTDPDNDHVYYLIDWGDNTTSGWIGLYDSGADVKINHTWSTKGTFIIKAKAKDNFSGESDWASLSVKMPFSFDIPFPSFWERLFERFPHAFPMLRQLLGY